MKDPDSIVMANKQYEKKMGGERAQRYMDILSTVLEKIDGYKNLFGCKRKNYE